MAEDQNRIAEKFEDWLKELLSYYGWNCILETKDVQNIENEDSRKDRGCDLIFEINHPITNSPFIYYLEAKKRKLSKSNLKKWIVQTLNTYKSLREGKDGQEKIQEKFGNEIDSNNFHGGILANAQANSYKILDMEDKLEILNDPELNKTFGLREEIFVQHWNGYKLRWLSTIKEELSKVDSKPKYIYPESEISPHDSATMKLLHSNILIVKADENGFCFYSENMDQKNLAYLSQVILEAFSNVELNSIKIFGEYDSGDSDQNLTIDQFEEKIQEQLKLDEDKVNIEQMQISKKIDLRN